MLVALMASACFAEDITDAEAVLRADGTPGDPEYGAYLAQECAACHLAESTSAVPSIAGIEPGYFRMAMAEYGSRIRENAAMENVARSLGDEELAALAAYFATNQH